MSSLPSEQNAPTTTTERLFFALWPDDALRWQLQQSSKPLLEQSGGRAVPAENLHITLAFLGRVDQRQRACVEAMADAIHCPAFSLQLDHAGVWPRPRVLWLAPTQMPDALTTLAADLHRGAETCGLKLDARPYRAHVTIKRKLRGMPGGGARQEVSIEPVAWTAREFVLVRSTSGPQGVNYTPVRRWQFIPAG